MQLVFIVLGIIIVLSLITGIILTIKEKKKTSNGSLTDNPNVLFNDTESDFDKSDKFSVISSDNKEKETCEDKISDSEGFDLPTNDDYNSHKFAISSVSDAKEASVDELPKIEEPIVVENKSLARFIYNEEEII